MQDAAIVSRLSGAQAPSDIHWLTTKAATSRTLGLLYTSSRGKANEAERDCGRGSARTDQQRNDKMLGGSEELTL